MVNPAKNLGGPTGPDGTGEAPTFAPLVDVTANEGGAAATGAAKEAVRGQLAEGPLGAEEAPYELTEADARALGKIARRPSAYLAMSEEDAAALADELLGLAEDEAA